jgi:hypothetical protein
VAKWAGIGALRYIPDHLLGDKYNAICLKYQKKDQEEEEDNDLKKYIQEIEQINTDLVERLQSQDAAFSLGQADDHMVAIKLGMVNEMNDLKRLASQVQDQGKELEESMQYLQKMSKVILDGIVEANAALKIETEQKMSQQGLIRQIPMVGGLLNWFSPIDNPKVIGRSFDLHSGKVATTESTIKYHMQINGPPLDNQGINVLVQPDLEDHQSSNNTNQSNQSEMNEIK